MIWLQKHGRPIHRARGGPGALLLSALIGVTSGWAQSPYVDRQEREIKALSTEVIDGYRAGRGMGLALAAELNGYPGPKHVLELAEGLGITEEQEARVRASFERMHADALRLGRMLVELERQLDGLFATAVADPTSVRDTVRKLGEVHAELRYAHLVAHLEMRGILTSEQVERYQALRGYTGVESHGGHHDQHGHRGHHERPGSAQ